MKKVFTIFIFTIIAGINVSHQQNYLINRNNIISYLKIKYSVAAMRLKIGDFCTYPTKLSVLRTYLNKF